MLLQANGGLQYVADGVSGVDAAAGRNNQLAVDEVQGRFYFLASRGKLFTAANQTAVALSTKSTTYTGFGLNNPLGSNIMLSLLDVCVALATAPAGISNLHLEANTAVQGVVPTTVTALSTVCTQLGNSSVGVGVAVSAATLATAPTVIRAIGGGPNAAGSVTTPFIRDEIAGQIVLLPGTFVGLGYVTTAISAISSMVWAENPL